MTSEVNPLGLEKVWDNSSEQERATKNAIPIFGWNGSIVRKKLQGLVWIDVLKALRENESTLKEKLMGASYHVDLRDALRLPDGTAVLVFSWQHSYRDIRSGGHNEPHGDYETGWGLLPITKEEAATVDAIYSTVAKIILANTQAAEIWKKKAESLEGIIKQKKLDGIAVRGRRENCIKRAKLDDASIKEKRRAALLKAGCIVEDIEKYLRERH